MRSERSDFEDVVDSFLFGFLELLHEPSDLTALGNFVTVSASNVLLLWVGSKPNEGVDASSVSFLCCDV